jgi:hypothetical protein
MVVIYHSHRPSVCHAFRMSWQDECDIKNDKERPVVGRSCLYMLCVYSSACST